MLGWLTAASLIIGSNGEECTALVATPQTTMPEGYTMWKVVAIAIFTAVVAGFACGCGVGCWCGNAPKKDEDIGTTSIIEKDLKKELLTVDGAEGRHLRNT